MSPANAPGPAGRSCVTIRPLVSSPALRTLRTSAVESATPSSRPGTLGVIIAQGGSFNGWSLYAKDGKLKYCYNVLGIKLFYAESEQAIPAGQHQVRMEFKYDGRGLAKGGNALLYLDGKKAGEGRVGITVPMLFSADETCDIGKATGSAVSPDYDAKDNEFSGTGSEIRCRRPDRLMV